MTHPQKLIIIFFFVAADEEFKIMMVPVLVPTLVSATSLQPFTLKTLGKCKYYCPPSLTFCCDNLLIDPEDLKELPKN